MTTPIHEFLSLEKKCHDLPCMVYRVILPWGCQHTDWHDRIHVQQIGWRSQLADHAKVVEEVLFFQYWWTRKEGDDSWASWESWRTFLNSHKSSLDVVPYCTVDTSCKYLWLNCPHGYISLPMKLFDIHAINAAVCDDIPRSPEVCVTSLNIHLPHCLADK